MTPGASPRRVVRLTRGEPASDGAGVRLTRLIGTPDLDSFDPFLLLDRFESDDPHDYLAGFPSHPHRGFETVTYLLAGRMRHADNAGHEGVIEAGGVQWMTAGRGIVHSEMPEQEHGLLRGFQLWVNLPAALKMSAPRYQELGVAAIPIEARGAGVVVRVIAGETGQGTRGAVTEIATAPLYLDITLGAGLTVFEPVAVSHNVMLVVVEGEIAVPGGPGAIPTTVSARTLALLGSGAGVEFHGRATRTRVLLIAGRPLGEPVTRAGPFVMNTAAELREAFRDYQQGRF